MMKAIALALLLLLPACSAVDVAKKPVDVVSAQKTVYELKLSYAAALEVAVAYNKLPRCGLPTSPIICSSQNVVTMMRKANDVAIPALDAAENTTRQLNVDANVLDTAIAAATQAVGALKAIQNANKVKT